MDESCSSSKTIGRSSICIIVRAVKFRVVRPWDFIVCAVIVCLLSILFFVIVRVRRLILIRFDLQSLAKSACFWQL